MRVRYPLRYIQLRESQPDLESPYDEHLNVSGCHSGFAPGRIFQQQSQDHMSRDLSGPSDYYRHCDQSYQEVLTDAVMHVRQPMLLRRLVLCEDENAE